MYKIIIDSCGELTNELKSDGHFKNVALEIEVNGQRIVDDETFDQPSFLKKVKEEIVEGASAADTLNSVSGTTGKKKPGRTDILNSRGLELFDGLRELRMAIAREEGVPPYLIFSDKTLVEMCIKLPADRKEMLRVSGVGENKAKKYGQRFADRILEFTGGQREKLHFGEIEEVLGGGSVKKASAIKREFSLTA